MLRNLLRADFGVHKSDLQQLQNHDLHLKNILQQVKNKENNAFVIKGGILFQKHPINPEHYLLALPPTISEAIIWNLHAMQSFHFSAKNMYFQLSR